MHAAEGFEDKVVPVDVIHPQGHAPSLETSADGSAAPSTAGTRNWKLQLGWVLIIFSVVVYGLLLLIPFLDVSNTFKIAITPTIVIVGEVTFWTGGFLVGKEVVRKYKSRLSPKNWFKPKLKKEVAP